MLQSAICYSCHAKIYSLRPKLIICIPWTAVISAVLVQQPATRPLTILQEMRKSKIAMVLFGKQCYWLCTLQSHQLAVSHWELVSPDAYTLYVHCCALQLIPHRTNNVLYLAHRSSHSTTLPSWLASLSIVLLHQFVQTSKFHPLVDEVELIGANLIYAHIHHINRWELTTSLTDHAPWPPCNIHIACLRLIKGWCCQ